MRKSVVLLLVLVFLTASSIISAKPAFSSAGVAENSWASKAPMQVARGALGVAAVNGKIYAIGGSAKDVRMATTKEFLGTNEEYDPEMNKWIMKREMLTPRAALATAVYQNKIYCIGGKTSSGYTGVNEVYDPETDTWETKTSMPTARGFLSANVVNGKIYLMGGYPPEVWNVTQAYDPVTDSWATKAPLPAVGEPASVVFDGNIYRMGAMLQIYNPETDVWSEGTPKPSNVGVVYGAGVTTGALAPKGIYAIGDSVGVYNPESDAWLDGAEKPADQKDFGVAVVNDLLYVVGGYTYDSLYAVYGVGFFEPLALNEQYTPFGYGTISPVVSIISPQNQTYSVNNVALIFRVSEPANWAGYSLDGEENVTVMGNVTLTGLANGTHSLTVYVNKTFGAMVASETVNFTVSVLEPEHESFPILLVATASVIVIVAALATLLVYFKKWKHKIK